MGAKPDALTFTAAVVRGACEHSVEDEDGEEIDVEVSGPGGPRRFTPTRMWAGRSTSHPAQAADERTRTPCRATPADAWHIEKGWSCMVWRTTLV